MKNKNIASMMLLFLLASCGVNTQVEEVIEESTVDQITENEVSDVDYEELNSNIEMTEVEELTEVEEIISEEWTEEVKSDYDGTTQAS